MHQIFVVSSFVWVGYEFNLNNLKWFLCQICLNVAHVARIDFIWCSLSSRTCNVTFCNVQYNSNAWAKTLADAAGEWCSQCNWYWGRCKHILTFVLSMSTASQQHNDGKRVCRRDIDYETGETTAAPTTTASFVGGRHLSAVAYITPSKFVGGNAPPIHHVTMPVGGMRVSDLPHEKHTDNMTLSVSTKGLHSIVKECIKKNNCFTVWILWQTQAQAV